MDFNLHSAAMSLHERLLAARRGQRRADFQLAVLLAEMATDRLYAELGYSSLSNYADVVLELSPRSARELVALGRRLPDLPHISARLEAWVERAATVSCRVNHRRSRREVRRAPGSAAAGAASASGPPEAGLRDGGG